MTSTFDRARRRRFYARLARAVAGHRGSRDLLPLDEATERLRPFARRYVGLRAVPVDRIVGTDSRGSDFDRAFLPRRPDLRARWQSVEQAFPDAAFPPIVVYRLGDAYFVLDGHHRVAIARQLGMATIDAEVTELRARWRLPADADVVELIHAEQERIFMDESGLGDALPDVRMRFSRPVGYLQLLENVQIHGYHLMLAAGRALPRDEIARRWHADVFRPALEVIRVERLDEICPDATDADRFLWVYERRRELVPELGCQELAEATRRAADELWRSRRRLRRARPTRPSPAAPPGR